MIIDTALLLIGDGKLVESIAICLLTGGHPVVLLTGDKCKTRKSIESHFERYNQNESGLERLRVMSVQERTDIQEKYTFGIAVTSEKQPDKEFAIRLLEEYLYPSSPLLINAECISLDLLQKMSDNPNRVIGVNWVEPAYATLFLELMVNEKTDEILVDELLTLARTKWKKDPYLVTKGISIRTRMLCGMVREAFFLVQNGYATIEDIDRACRNDAGYYLPFAGNFRYMDLMGTYAYGLVMKDLNKELSRETTLPPFFREILERDGQGMENNLGFYEYQNGDAMKWDELVKRFSYQMKELMGKYPFNHEEQ